MVDFSDHLEETVVTVDETEVPLQELGYYIMETEEYVYQLAEIYNPTDTMQFWRLHFNGIFIITEAKNSAMNTCIRDNVYCLEAEAAGMSLTDEEIAAVEEDVADLLDGLSYKQQQSLQYDAQSLQPILEKVALARKYANSLLESVDWTDYDQTPEVAVEIDGDYYEEVLATHDVVINKKLWKKISLGSITISKVDLPPEDDEDEE